MVVQASSGVVFAFSIPGKFRDVFENANPECTTLSLDLNRDPLLTTISTNARTTPTSVDATNQLLLTATVTFR